MHYNGCYNIRNILSNNRSNNIIKTNELPIPVSDDKLIFDSKALEEKLYEKLIFLYINSA